ncbi:hypothetical protein FACS1894109_02450 [Spirochaetia bacterium]|nr:hypothetical protein FACS1894109_02450 [Spirochaetia bacterium]
MPELTQNLNTSTQTEPELPAELPPEGAHSPEKLKVSKRAGGTSRKIYLLRHISKVADSIRENGIYDDTLENIKTHLRPFEKEFGISPVQAALLAGFLDHFDDSSISIGVMAGSVNCTRFEFLQYQDDIQVLEDKKLIRSRQYDENTFYRVPMELMEALNKGEHYKPAEHRNIPLTEFLEITGALFDQRPGEEISYAALAGELKDLIKLNPDLPFCQKLTAYGLSDESMILLMYFCFMSALYFNNGIFRGTMESIYDNASAARKMTRAFLDDTHELLRRKLIAKTIVDEDEYPASEYSVTFALTEKTKKDLIGELVIRQKRKPKEMRDENGLTGHKTIKQRVLFYNAAEAEQIDKLAELLKGDNYRKVCKRLADSGMRTGFACLFSGGPGTGKTETAFQLARKTGRDIMKVDVPAIIGSFVGESEKNIKQQFDRYRAVVKSRKTAPVLLFNEADALFTKRMQLGQANPTVQQMWNVMQNILLEEMENFTGILIATTNMVSNLDKAFERRFLFKIRFDKPNAVGRRSIWQTMIPGLSSADAETLAKSFDFSGGQIENIARKCIMENALSGKAPALGELISFCDKELLEKKSNGIIGFTTALF